MDLFDCLVHEQAEKDDGRPRRREIVLTEELVLPRARLIELQIAGEAVAPLDRDPVFQLEALGS